jgi:hypothetical protein
MPPGENSPASEVDNVTEHAQIDEVGQDLHLSGAQFPVLRVAGNKLGDEGQRVLLTDVLRQSVAGAETARQEDAATQLQ